MERKKNGRKAGEKMKGRDNNKVLALTCTNTYTGTSLIRSVDEADGWDGGTEVWKRMRLPVKQAQQTRTRSMELPISCAVQLLPSSRSRFWVDESVVVS